MAIRFETSNLSSADFNLSNIEKFNGVDYTTTPTLVDDSRAIDISNYLPKGNSLVKRNGIEMVATLIDNTNTEYVIHDIWETPQKEYTQVLSNDTYHFVFVTEKNANGYINPKILSVRNLLDKDYQSIAYQYEFDNYDYTTSPILTDKDLYSYGVYFEGRLFILCMGQYLFTEILYTDDDKVSLVRLAKVRDHAYVPTVITNLADERLNFKVTQLQEFNLLSNLCNIELAVVLGAIDSTTDVFNVGQFFDSSQTLELVNVENGVFDNENNDYIVYDVGRFSFNSETREILLTDKSEVYYEDEGKIVTVKLTFRYSQLKQKDISVVEKMRFGVPYGSYGHTDRLFLSGNPDYPNLDIHSGETNDVLNSWKDYTYFGDNSYATVGSNDTAITSYGFLNNGYMAVFKESKMNQPNLYLRTYQMVENEQGYLEERFPINISGVSVDINVKSNIINYENDLLVNCPSGIYKIIAGESTATQTYNSTEMSYFIRDNLGTNVDNSSSIVFDGKLFISREDLDGKKRVYIADYKRYGYIDGRQVYEWFVLDDLDVNKFFVLNGELYFSNEKGLFKFNDKFEDMYYLQTKKANVNGRTYSEEIFVNSNSKRIILSSTNKEIQKIVKSDDVLNEWNKFKNKTKIKISEDFLIKALDDKPQFVGDEYGIVKFTVEFDKENPEKSLFVPVIAQNLLYNTTGYSKDDQALYSPAVIYNGKYYFIKKVELEMDKYILECELNGEEEGWEEYTQDYIILKLNGLHQHFDFDIDEMYHLSTYPLSKCEIIDDDWYYKNQNNEYIYLGNKSEVYFNEFSLKLFNFSIDFYAINDYIENVILTFYSDVKCYWRSKFTSLGRLDYLKTIDRFTFVADSKRGGDTNVGFRTIKKNVLSPTSVEYKDFNFDEVDFSHFSFSTSDFAKTQTIKKKVKNFSFVQVVFESNNDRDSSITSISFRYKYTKNNKGVK